MADLASHADLACRAALASHADLACRAAPACRAAVVGYADHARERNNAQWLASGLAVRAAMHAGNQNRLPIRTSAAKAPALLNR